MAALRLGWRPQDPTGFTATIDGAWGQAAFAEWRALASAGYRLGFRKQKLVAFGGLEVGGGVAGQKATPSGAQSARNQLLDGHRVRRTHPRSFVSSRGSHRRGGRRCTVRSRLSSSRRRNSHRIGAADGVFGRDDGSVSSDGGVAVRFHDVTRRGRRSGHHLGSEAQSRGHCKGPVILMKRM